jgi:penicillin-binding protein 1C
MHPINQKLSFKHFSVKALISSIKNFFTLLLKRKRSIVFFSLLFLALIWYSFCLPKELFNDPYSFVLTSSNNELLSARIAADEQWRFPEVDSLSKKYIECITQYEDKYFFFHPGFNPVSLLKATIANLKAGEIVSGGSTISMQVIRLHRKNKKRSFSEKFLEIILATRLELRYTKEEILLLYASHAPFGGNVVGIEAASWRYFGRTFYDLTWAENATLAVLPNAPSLMHPGKNREKLKTKRNKLLKQLFEATLMDSLSYSLALIEELPNKPLPLPNDAAHLARFVQQKYSVNSFSSSIDKNLQNTVQTIVNSAQQKNKHKQIHNACAIVIEVKTGRVLAYVGNAETSAEHSPYVDIIQAKRSSGSILKPFLYAAALNEGKLLPDALLADIPTRYDDYTPKNFTFTYLGAVPASDALTKSLNVPAVRLLKHFGQEKFYYQLQKLGITSLNYHPEHYGLSLILGGADVTLWDVSHSYASMARVLNNFNNTGLYYASDYKFRQVANEGVRSYTEPTSFPTLLNASSVWFTFKAMNEVKRPKQMYGWQLMASSKSISWKTGTSFGFKDAWSVGVTPEFVVGVWAGNADGEGRPGLTGSEIAAPIMFDIFNVLPVKNSFSIPLDDLENRKICTRSGYLATDDCISTEIQFVPRVDVKPYPCAYHKRIFLTSDKKFRVNRNCYNSSDIIDTSWFVLPPAQAYHFRKHNTSYKPLPSVHSNCINENNIKNFELIYPKPNSRFYNPKNLDGSIAATIFEIAHRNINSTIYWYIDDTFLGSTTSTHQFPVQDISAGEHILTVTDNLGETKHTKFWVIEDTK